MHSFADRAEPHIADLSTLADVEDGSHRPHRIPTTMAPETEAVHVELHQLFLLPVDDLLRVGRDFLDPSLAVPGPSVALPEAQGGQ